MPIKFNNLGLFVRLLSITTFMFLGNSPVSFAQLEQKALLKIDTVTKLISNAEQAGLDATKEKATIRTAQIFLKYANWDAQNVAINEKGFNTVPIYKSNANRMALALPDFERGETIKILDEAIKNLKAVIAGTIIRKPVPQIDWSEVSLDNGKLMSNNKPVFLSDFTWKPAVPELTNYFGNLDGFYISPVHIADNYGGIKAGVLNNLKNKVDGTIGNIFLNHRFAMPAWIIAKYPDIEKGGRLFTSYDIDHPGTRELQSYLLKNTVPFIAGKKYSELGYLLTNEPHWFTAKEVWATGEVSEYTKTKFRNWLGTKYTDINDLNANWNQSFSSFDAVTITIPIDANLQGTPIWYDWVTFNTVRVTEWFNFLKSEVRKYDANAKVHIKVMPNLWSNNSRDHGLDMEELLKLSDIIGNDAGASNSHMWGPTEDWESKYAYDWRELSMSYDFFKSVSPHKIIFNSETHFLSAVKFLDMYLKPEYARSVYWLAYLHGLNVSQAWVWAREVDGSYVNNIGDDFAATLMHQPRILNEVTSTVMDLNAYATEIDALQQARKPLRIFYSKTSAINKTNHMDDVFGLYEPLSFTGNAVGFATQDILNTQNHSAWDAVLISKTEFVTKAEFNAIQTYLNNGGTVIIDAFSLKKDEYGKLLNLSLTAGVGTLLTASSSTDMVTKALNVLTVNNTLPPITLTESTSSGKKACYWRAVTTTDGRNIISITNLGKGNANISLGLNNSTKAVSCKNLLNGQSLPSTLTMASQEVLLLEVTPETSTWVKEEENQSYIRLYPNPTTDKFTVILDQLTNKLDVLVFDNNGKKITERTFRNTQSAEVSLNDQPSGIYLISIRTHKGLSSFKMIKK